jgi:hypothetical protein
MYHWRSGLVGLAANASTEPPDAPSIVPTTAPRGDGDQDDMPSWMIVATLIIGVPALLALIMLAVRGCLNAKKSDYTVEYSILGADSSQVSEARSLMPRDHSVTVNREDHPARDVTGGSMINTSGRAPANEPSLSILKQSEGASNARHSHEYGGVDATSHHADAS